MNSSSGYDLQSDDQTIWRYMDFTKLAWVIQEGKLHFHRLGDFTDQFEGTIPKGLETIRRDELANLISNGKVPEVSYKGLLEETIQRARSSLFVNCWHASEEESAAMWDIYGQSGRAIGVQSTAHRLRGALSKSSSDLFVRPVAYVDFYSRWKRLSDRDKQLIKQSIIQDRELGVTGPAFLKRKEFDYEKEVRAVIPRFPAKGWEDVNPPDYYNIDVDVDILIDSIHLAPDTPDWVAETVKTFVKRSQTSLSDSDVFSSRMVANPWNIE